jgi:hypothetical protein
MYATNHLNFRIDLIFLLIHKYVAYTISDFFFIKANKSHELVNLIFMTFFSVLVVQWENIYTINHSLLFSLFMYVYHSNVIQCQKQNLA